MPGLAGLLWQHARSISAIGQGVLAGSRSAIGQDVSSPDIAASSSAIGQGIVTSDGQESSGTTSSSSSQESSASSQGSEQNDGSYPDHDEPTLFSWPRPQR
jgi:hypothetical protein